MTTVTKKFNVFATTKNISNDDDGTLYIEGIANTGKEDLVGDIVTETALQQIVAQAPQRNLHYNHESGRKDLLGRIVESELRPEGAWIKTRILNEQKEWLQSYIDQDIIFGQSISGCCTYEEGSYDNIIEWELTEVSLTDTPCDPATMGTVAISKSFDDIILSLKQKEQRKEADKMADDTLSREDIITIVNDAYNERKEELLEQIREEVGKEYDVKINELIERISTIEEQLKEPDNDPDDPPANPDDDGKAFQEALDKAVNEKVSDILKGLTQDVNSRYDKNKHIKDDNQDDNKPKSHTAEEIAKML